MSESKHTGGWSYSINYGPEGETNYANVFDAEERLVGNLRLHHAIAVVNTMSAVRVLLAVLTEVQFLLRAAKQTGYLNSQWEPILDRVDTALSKDTGES